MRTIAVLNQKGGVGKTTTAVNLSAALAATSARVCLIDLDPQAHATLHLGLQSAGQRPTIYDVLTGDAELRDAWHEVQENLWVVGSHIDLAAAEVELPAAHNARANAWPRWVALAHVSTGGVSVCDCDTQ